MLAGDWLYMQAFQIALRERNFRILDLLIGLTQMMVEGELLQLERIGRIDVTEADCMELVDRKTACLFSVCARLGALAAQRRYATAGAARRIRLEPGHGVSACRRRAGFHRARKDARQAGGGDLREGKVTLPLVYALECASPEERRLVGNHSARAQLRRGAVPRILAHAGKVPRHRAGEGARAGIHRQGAARSLPDFPESPYQRALLPVTDLVTERDH